MLSRSNSSAGERLRRAKSTSSTHTSSSGHQRTHTSIDPFVTRYQAETAALEAYQRARELEAPACPAYKSVPPKLQRRRSQVTGRSEGSHLEDFRLGRRQSTSRKENVKVRPAPAQQLSEKTTVEKNGDEISIRRRYVVPPNPKNRQPESERASLPNSGRFTRRSESGYTAGSPVPRNPAGVKDQSSTIQRSTPQGEHNDGYSANLSQLSDFGEPGSTTTPAIRVTQNDTDAIAMARDKCLLDFHQHKLRERKSFIHAPLQKIRAATVTKESGSNFDTSLPPFNYANELVPPPVPLSVITAAPIKMEKKSRNFSDSLKGRFKKVFRKVSRAPSGLPAQHVEAKDFRFSTYLEAPSSAVNRDDDPFYTVSDQQSISTREVKTASASTRGSADEQSTTKSRVTSWTDSTVPDTWSTRNEAELSELAGDHAQLKRTGSVSTLRKTPSFFGRSLKNRLHRSSRAEMRGSDESAGLYSALQERIKPVGTESPSVDADKRSVSTTTSALATLPSQQRARSSLSSNSRRIAPTIRSVTPEPTSCKLDIPSPVAEVLSPDEHQPPQARVGHLKVEHYNATPRSQLQRRLAVKAPTPSKEQIARRIEKSKNRWQSPLDELSPPPPQPSTRVAMMEDNPYELRSRSRSWQQQHIAISNDLPHHAKVSDKQPSTRYDVLSPSVYSRRTDGDTPQQDSAAEKGDMMVTITGREVRSYSISPAKRERHDERPMQGSADWRRWLSSEMDGLNDSRGTAEFALPQTIVKDPRPSPHRIDTTEVDDESLARQDESNLAGGKFEVGNWDALAQHSHIGSKTSLSHSDRHSAVQSQKQERLGAPRNGMDSKVSSTSTTTSANTDRQSSNNPSIDNHTKDKTNAYKPKSAFDLRANYKTSNSEVAKPIAVLRKSSKPNNNNIYILEDTTIQNISAGPYASQHPATTTGTTSAYVNKENSPPSEANSLPVVSSSEWLSARANRKREIKGTSGLDHGRSRSRSRSGHSPSRSPNTIVPSGGSSPGQRLVTNWLDGKKPKESSPAFV